MDDVLVWLKRDWRRLSVTMVSTIYLSGCMVGPNFHSPKSPDVTAYTAKPLPGSTVSVIRGGNAGKSQVYVYGRDIPAEWWQLFHSSEIDQLVKLGIQNNPDLTAAQAALRQAQETLYAQFGNLMIPGFDGNFGAQRQRFSGSTFGGGVPSSVFNVFTLNVKVAYTLDVFGGSRRELESLRAQVDYQQFLVIATYLTLASNIVNTAITIASYEEQIKATKALIAAEQAQLNILRKQYYFGGIANTNVLQQQTLVDQAKATLPPLEKSLSQSRHAMATLIGEFPNTAIPSINLNKLNLPHAIPVSLSSNLVKQRPDVRAAEALLHSASAQIGVATANLFPQFDISGAYGWTNAVLSSLFGPNNKAWAIAMQATQPLFHGGALFAERRAAIAVYDQSLAQYKQTLLTAFQNTADSLRAIDRDAVTYKEAKSAEISARDALAIIRKQYKDGGVAYLNLLTAEQQYQQTRIASIQAQAQRYADTVALYQALGGGWWNRSQAQGLDPVNTTHASLSRQ